MTEANDSVNQTDVTANASASGENSSTDTVKYETYKKVLSEKKRRDDEVRELRETLEKREAEDKAKAESELEQQNKYKELLDLRTSELEKAKAEANHMRESRQQAMKLDSFLESLDSKLPKQYWGLVDLEAIKLNPDTHEVDDGSVASAVEIFRKSYPEVLLKKSTTTGLPSSAPSGTAAATRGDSQYANLPTAEKNRILAAELVNLKK